MSTLEGTFISITEMVSMEVEQAHFDEFFEVRCLNNDVSPVCLTGFILMYYVHVITFFLYA